ncbi:TlpA family protein disulfide reductase [Natronococcus wangiae]|uniref:TlpA family protein disulfide reductase n=1 Tax=Natronococcus wangiae TaxID=3068275 RepID=UPI00273EF965|nr:TlpA family protein disulfide reductase [Natronococcus sp. AD5]
MRRRAVLALAGAAVGGCLDDWGGAGDAESGGDMDEGNGSDESDAESPPFDVTTVEAPGSDAGTVSVPREEVVTFLNFTRLLCPTSEGLIGTIGDVRTELESRYDVGPDGDVWFISVINPNFGADPSREELAEWWDEHDGQWAIGIDEGSSLNEYYEVGGYPTVVTLDDDGEVHWRDTGGTSSDNMITGVERALEAESAVADPDSDESESES